MLKIGDLLLDKDYGFPKYIVIKEHPSNGHVDLRILKELKSVYIGQYVEEDFWVIEYSKSNLDE